MDAREYLEIMHLLEKLKDTTRHCYTTKGRHESVAEHTYRCALMAYFLKDEFADADTDKIIKMCLIHDLGEIFTGDIPTFNKTASDEIKEDNLLGEWVDSLPSPFDAELRELYVEMSEQVSIESKIYKAIDKLEAVIQHNESPIDTWEPLEYELNVNYGFDKVEFSDWLKNLREEIRKDTLEKIEKEGKNI